MKMTVTLASLTILVTLYPASAYDFLEKRECTVQHGTRRVAVHTTCVISGGMQGGTIDVTIKTPDGKKYPLEGPIGGERGHTYLLQKSPATAHSAGDESCYRRKDRKTEICLGGKVD